MIDPKVEHDEFVKEVSNIMAKLNPDINKPEFQYSDAPKKYMINPSKIDLLVQVGGTIIIFECKLNIELKKRSKQLDFHYKNLNKNKLKFVQTGRLNNFNEIIKIFATKNKNKLINTETMVKFDINSDFINNPKIIL